MRPADSLRAVPEAPPGVPGCPFAAVAPSSAVRVCTGRPAARREKAKPDTDFPDWHGGGRWLFVCLVYFVVAPFEWTQQRAPRCGVRQSRPELVRRPKRTPESSILRRPANNCPVLSQCVETTRREAPPQGSVQALAKRFQSYCKAIAKLLHCYSKALPKLCQSSVKALPGPCQRAVQTH